LKSEREGGVGGGGEGGGRERGCGSEGVTRGWRERGREGEPVPRNG
jgi:hypothetical protein